MYGVGAMLARNLFGYKLSEADLVEFAESKKDSLLLWIKNHVQDDRLITKEVLDLVRSMLQINPNLRPSASQALQATFFNSEPHFIKIAPFTATKHAPLCDITNILN